MKIRMEYAAVVALLIAICAMAGAYGLPSGNAPNEVSPLFNVRMDQAMEEMGAGIPGLDPKNDWSFGSINERSLATSNELTQIIDYQAVLGHRPTSGRTCRSTCPDTCRQTCVATCPRTCVATCANTCRSTCPDTCRQTCVATCPRTCVATCPSTCVATCPRTCVATCANTCRSTCPDTCRRTCGATCAGFTCWRTCGATCGNKQTCRSTCAQTCGMDCVCQNNNLFEVRT